jgi:hypothetical protein
MKRPARMGQVSLEMVSLAKLLSPLNGRLSINGFLKMHILRKSGYYKKAESKRLLCKLLIKLSQPSLL